MSADAPSSTQTRILDATLVVMQRDGLAKLALEEVAAVADVSRQTVYRHFGSRDGLLGAVIVREEEGILTLVVRAADQADDLESAIRNGLAAALQSTGEHPLLQRLLQSEPEALLPFLTLGSGPVISIVGPAIADIVARWRPEIGADELEFIGDTLGRVAVSFAVSPRGEVDETARRLARLVTDHADAAAARASGGAA